MEITEQMGDDQRDRVGKEEPCRCMKSAEWQGKLAANTSHLIGLFVEMLVDHHICESGATDIFKNFIRLTCDIYEDVSFLSDIQREIEVDRKLEVKQDRS